MASWQDYKSSLVKYARYSPNEEKYLVSNTEVSDSKDIVESNRLWIFDVWLKEKRRQIWDSISWETTIVVAEEKFLCFSPLQTNDRNKKFCGSSVIC